MAKECNSCASFIHLLREVFVSFFEAPGARDAVREGIEAMSEAEFLRFLDKWIWATKQMEPGGEEEQWKH